MCLCSADLRDPRGGKLAPRQIPTGCARQQVAPNYYFRTFKFSHQETGEAVPLKGFGECQCYLESAPLSPFGSSLNTSAYTPLLTQLTQQTNNRISYDKAFPGPQMPLLSMFNLSVCVQPMCLVPIGAAHISQVHNQFATNFSRLALEQDDSVSNSFFSEFYKSTFPQLIIL